MHSSVAHSASTASHRNTRDDREAPLDRVRRADHAPIPNSEKQKYFFGEGLTHFGELPVVSNWQHSGRDRTSVELVLQSETHHLTKPVFRAKAGGRSRLSRDVKRAIIVFLTRLNGVLGLIDPDG
jgi:hypothetical protein